MIFQDISRILKEVDKGTLLDEFILFVDAHVFHLLLCFNEMIGLDLFGSVSPLVTELLQFVATVHIVEDGEFGSQ